MSSKKFLLSEVYPIYQKYKTSTLCTFPEDDDRIAEAKLKILTKFEDRLFGSVCAMLAYSVLNLSQGTRW